ncbi:methyltransferase domain-containing protein [bacterium]|nr:methyltransferase domain-containing protein [bacterium]
MNETPIINHYQKGDLLETIYSTLKNSGKELSDLTTADLRFMDELHIGGHAASLQLAKTAALPANSEVLDVGCGIGGPARLLAAEYDCQVTGLDITEEYCKIAETLTKAVGLKSKVSFINGNALCLPFAPESFDAIWSQHCSMNVENKRLLFSEFSRVLKNRGQLIVHDVTKGPNQPIYFPVPWAGEESISHLIEEDTMLILLQKSGFRSTHWKNISGWAQTWFKGANRPAPQDSPPPLTQKLVTGDGLKTMVRNVIKNLDEDRIRVFEGIFTSE